MIIQTKKGTYKVGLERADDYSSRFAVVSQKKLILGIFSYWKEVHRMCVTDWEVMTPWDRELTFTMACLDYEKHLALSSAAGVQ